MLQDLSGMLKMNFDHVRNEDDNWSIFSRVI